jgi:uncharacterized protein
VDLVNSRGLNADGTIAREGSLERVGAPFVPVVEAARARIIGTFGERLHSGYLYGSIPRGTATPGGSDLDLLVVLHSEASDVERADARAIEAALDSSFSQIDGVGIVMGSTGVILSELERYDGGFFVACLCSPLVGDDLAAQLPSYRPTGLLARETNGDLALLLPGWRARAASAASDGDWRVLSRRVGRRLARTGFTLVMRPSTPPCTGRRRRGPGWARAGRLRPRSRRARPGRAGRPRSRRWRRGGRRRRPRRARGRPRASARRR